MTYISISYPVRLLCRTYMNIRALCTISMRNFRVCTRASFRSILPRRPWLPLRRASRFRRPSLSRPRPRTRSTDTPRKARRHRHTMPFSSLDRPFSRSARNPSSLLSSFRYSFSLIYFVKSRIRILHNRDTPAASAFSSVSLSACCISS